MQLVQLLESANSVEATNFATVSAETSTSQTRFVSTRSVVDYVLRKVSGLSVLFPKHHGQ